LHRKCQNNHVVLEEQEVNMGFFARRKIAMWGADLKQWARTRSLDESLSNADQNYALGVRFYADFAISHGRTPNPFEPWIDTYPPETAVGVEDARVLMNGAVKSQEAPGKDFAALLRAAHDERTSEGIARNPLADLGDVLGSLRNRLDEDLKTILPVDDGSPGAEIGAVAKSAGLSEQRFCGELRSWAMAAAPRYDDGSFEADFLRGLVLATHVRDQEEPALMIDFQIHPSGEWNGNPAAFMSGYVSTMRRWGMPSFFEQCPFDAEYEESMLGLAAKWSEDG
jgi:hypothetical protein